MSVKEFQLVLHMPTTPEGKQALSKRVAAVHANAVGECIRGLNWSQEQKEALLYEVLRQSDESGA